MILNKGLISGDTEVVKEFEESFAQYLNVKHAIAVNSGTSALEIAFFLAGIGKGDEVILPSFTIASCLFPILRLGAKPIFIDCELDSWQMSADEVIKKITKKTKVILVVHTYGLAVEMSSILNACTKNNIILIEDCAEAHGLKYKGSYCGSFGDIATFSFYANKLITTGEGGMLIVKNKRLADLARKVRNLSFNTERRFKHDLLGWNYRLSSIQAALGISQLKKINSYIVNRRHIATRYRDNLKDISGLTWQALKNNGSDNIFWVNGVIIHKEHFSSAKEAAKSLAKVGIETRPFFYPLHKQPLLKKYKIMEHGKLYNTEYISKYGLYLPGGNTLDIDSVDSICEKVKEILKSRI
jgi:perosamine synthetase